MALSLTASFWTTVADCLVDFHGQQSFVAQERVLAYRGQLADEAHQFGPEWMEDLVYHVEPWQLACDLAETQLDFNDYREEYERIRLGNGLAGLNFQPVTFGHSYPSLKV